MKWEYYLIALDEWKHLAVKENRLLELGKEGWELVSVSDSVAYFKRPLEEKKNHYTKDEIERFTKIGQIGDTLIVTPYRVDAIGKPLDTEE